jgi:hypothetical protein
MKVQRTCELCGRVGTRCWQRNTDGRTVCRNQSGCVTRLCEKLFRPKPKLPDGWVDLGYVDQTMGVRFLADLDAQDMRATLQLKDSYMQKITFPAPMGGPL